MDGWFRVRLGVLVVGWLSAMTTLAQEAGPPAPPAPATPKAADGEVGRNLASLGRLVEVIRAGESQLAKLREEAGQAASDAEREALGVRIEAENERLDQLRNNLRRMAAGVEENDYQGDHQGGRDLKQKLAELLGPLLDGLQEATATPRQLEELRAQRVQWVKREALAGEALSRIDRLRAAAPGPEIAAELEETRRLWAARLAEAASEIGMADRAIANREQHKRTLGEAISDLFSQFWGNRGVNLLLGLVVLVAMMLGGRWLYRWLRRASPLHRRPGSLAARSADLVAAIVVVVAAVLAVLLTFYLRGDWMLLTLAAILLFGIAWAARNTLPPYLDQVRVLLNLGPVREGERLVHAGLPWRLDRLGFYSSLSNPELAGGTLRLPLRALVAMHSRPHDPKEPWFPTRDGDWVLMGDGTFGRIDQQTPEQVVVIRLGGSRKTWRTADFLADQPENLSQGFRIEAVFGIDYRHQAIATGDVPAILHTRLLEELTVEVGRHGIRSLKVEFKQAGPSSLDYAVLADFAGSVAPRWNVLGRLIPRACVDVCNQQGWRIPFTQITVHQE